MVLLLGIGTSFQHSLLLAKLFVPTTWPQRCENAGHTREKSKEVGVENRRVGKTWRKEKEGEAKQERRKRKKAQSG